MSVHAKLQEARIQLQCQQLKKSGHNKFANYDYFELGDFLPTIQSIFKEIGLCGTITFDKDMAHLFLTDVETNQMVTFSCPMVIPTMKGCNEIQALGAAQTYLRRYLYVNALEIVEHDAIDATTGQNDVKGAKHKPTDNELFQPDAEELEHLVSILETIKKLDKDFEAIAEFIEQAKMDNDEKVWIWDKLPSDIRSGIKKVNATKKESK